MALCFSPPDVMKRKPEADTRLVSNRSQKKKKQQEADSEVDLLQCEEVTKRFSKPPTVQQKKKLANSKFGCLVKLTKDGNSEIVRGRAAPFFFLFFVF